MQNDNTVFSWPITVYYEDTDAGGVVYHANYLKYFERARTEYLRSIGFKQNDLLQQNISFVVRNIDVDFIERARLDEQLIVRSYVSKLKKATVMFCQEIVNHQEVTLCKAMVKVACIDIEKLKPIAIPHYIYQEISNGDI
ncbi:tol-pal system-associated acyl-CoA thioesterase [Vibrio sp. S4M6]|uniref:tol-pal system-associated acyl-CoA thioesterase n=1 Tax=Vibrio sinus TaxID=2946865 RepID=UPI00202A22A6|nr:tol-pal system-associated acyl-CoA thioesterase [Vibrio sinus]